jgi:hypothetical protein
MWKELSNLSLKLHLQQISPTSPLLAFDFGLKNTGVAITNPQHSKAYVSTF